MSSITARFRGWISERADDQGNDAVGALHLASAGEHCCAEHGATVFLEYRWPNDNIGLSREKRDNNRRKGTRRQDGVAIFCADNIRGVPKVGAGAFVGCCPTS